MILTPKHWAEFQHYKDRAPAWIKLHRKLLDDFAFNRLPLASRALAPMLWLLASEYDGGAITAPLEEIAFRLRVTEDDLMGALIPLINAGFFESDSELLADRKHDAIPEKEREIQEKRREREDIRAVADATRPRPDDDFEEFWKAYPKREGANPKEPARKLYRAAVKCGSLPAEIRAGLGRYCEKERKNIGTPYIPQAAKWLRNRYWEGEQSTGPPSINGTPAHLQPPPGMPTLEEALAGYGSTDAQRTETEIRSDAGMGQDGAD